MKAAQRWRRIVAACLWLSMPGLTVTHGQQEAPEGRKLALLYCQTCHLFPEPDLLDRETWINGALPHMAPWLGVTKLNLAARPDGERLQAANVFPASPILSETNWSAIKKYYGNAAPSEPLRPTNKPPAKADLDLFKTLTVKSTIDVPFTTMVKIDAKNHLLYVGDAQEKTLKALRPDGTLASALSVESAPIGVEFRGTNLILGLVGRIFPSDERAGQVLSVAAGGLTPTFTRLLRGLPRLTHITISDMDGDGLEEVVLCGYGNSLGGLYLAKKQAGGGFAAAAIADGPGIIASFVHDWNGDGRPDILTLRGQAKEGVDIYYNRGTNYQAVSVIQYPPSHGSSSLKVLDFDHDGELDVLITNGDNGDYTSKPKAYHGLRLYKGLGKGEFKLIWFYPLNGAYGAIAADFDLDGDIDIAAVSFFPDYERYPEESFVYLENTSGMNFKPRTISDARQGRWLVMDGGDLDGDGDTDIVLGSFPRGPKTTWIPDELQKSWETNRVSVMILENKTR